MNKKQDGTWNVTYRLSHTRKSRYIKTHHFITEDNIVGDDDVSIDFIIDYFAVDLKKYRKKISDIEDTEILTVDDVRGIITANKRNVDLIFFIKQHIQKLKVGTRLLNHF